MNIQSLLNPPEVYSEDTFDSRSPSPNSSDATYGPASTRTGTKKHKIPKDAAIFIKGPCRGEVRYRPHETGISRELAMQHQKFQIHPPVGSIADYCRLIPYKSEKKSFLEKTGREGFDVFQYTYKMPGKDREYVVMWDYRIGLVRITPFFKCCEYSKTMPAKALGMNPGLKEITHSITGGALAAQGYWMPFEAAKAMAATFCYDVRFALTPIFGNGFVDTCTSKNDPDFASFRIDPAIVVRCTEQTRQWLTEDDEGEISESLSEPRSAPRREPPPAAVSIPRPLARTASIQAALPRSQGRGHESYGYHPRNDNYLVSPISTPASVAWPSSSRGWSTSPVPTSVPQSSFEVSTPSPWCSPMHTMADDESPNTRRFFGEMEVNMDRVRTQNSRLAEQMTTVGFLTEPEMEPISMARRSSPAAIECANALLALSQSSPHSPEKRWSKRLRAVEE